ncbi:MAG: SurA N-terminal domain-containing protein [Alphaproteobacteria bacterium]|nr:SurA N-terminal domain-containing protein [Alphaproteobacteria bacterium]
MLTALRKQAKSWVVKALLLILVLSFAIWGIGDIFYGNPAEETVASVGSSKITAGELNDGFNRSLANLQRQFGGQLTREQAIGIGLLQQTMQEQIGQRLVDLEATDMGISADDGTLRRLITEDPNFQTAGRFDRARFNQLLSRVGLSEEGYLETFRQEIARNALTAGVAAAAAVPDAQLDAIYRYRNEERRGRYLKIADADIEQIDAPDDAALDAIYVENEQRFTAPEYRTITYVTLEPENLLEEVEIAEEDVRATYDERSAQYITPEKRTVEQLLAPDEDKASQASALIEEGADFAAVADELDGVSFTALGEVTEAGMPAGLGADAFAVNEDEVTEPVKSPFGFHLFKVKAITPEEVTPFADVKDDIKRQLALVEAEDRLPALATQFDDELAAGLGVSEAAEAVGLAADTVDAVDRQGLDQAGEPVTALEGWPALIQTAFEAAKDEPSLLEETDDGAYYVLEVGDIVEPRLKELEEVRDEVVALYEDQQRREGAKTRAEEIRAKLQEAASFETIAADAGLLIETIEPIKRSASGADSGLNRAAIDILFATDAGAIADQVIETEDGVQVLAVDEIIEKAPSDDAEARDQLKAELERQVRSDLLDQFGRALQDVHSIEINEAALARLIENDGSQAYGGAAPRPQPIF